MHDLRDLRPQLYGVDSAGDIVRLLLVILAVGFFVHLAAKAVIDRSTLAEALVAALLGMLLSALAYALVTEPVLGRILSLLVFAGVTALIYRTKAVKGAAIGAVAWVLWLLAAQLLDWILRLLHVGK